MGQTVFTVTVVLQCIHRVNTSPHYHAFHVFRQHHRTCLVLLYQVFIFKLNTVQQFDQNPKMSFCQYKTYVEVGDTVLVYLTPKLMYPLKIKENEVYQTRFGALKHDDVIGKRYGSKVDCSRGYAHILDMTPELWTVTLPHRTQILYGADISFILIQLQLKPGSVVIEAGTGSGSLSHCIARTISPNGKLFTHDFHQERASTAQEEFIDHGLGSIVTVQHRDVCSDGFDVGQLVDAVFLDLPHPWEAIESANSALKNGGRICCFSPCIEQVQRSFQTLSNLNFMDIETYECVLRPYEVRDWKLKKFKYEPVKPTTHSEDLDEGASSEENDTENETNQRKKIKLDVEATCSNSNNSSKPNKKSLDTADYTISYMNAEVAGHTGFLTFATKFVTTSL